MKIPWRYVLGLPLGLLLGIAAFMIALYTQLGVPTQSSSFAHAIVEKKKAIAEALPGHRLLLVAGSSLLFGLDAKQIEQETGVPTVNLGTHAALGLDYIFYLTRQVAKPGDTVLLALEYELYMDQVSPGIHDDFILARAPDYFHQMSLAEKLDMATRISTTRLEKGWHNARHPEPEPAPHPPYTHAADYLNDRGDEIGNALAVRGDRADHLDYVIADLAQGIPSTEQPGFRQIRAFLAWAKAHQVRVLATFPNTIDRPQYHGPAGTAAIALIGKFYADEGVPVIGTAEETMLPADEFFDTVYHLTLEQAQQRTERFIPKLRPYLDNAK